MKRKLSIILALMLCLSLCACGGGNDTPETTVPENSINKEEIVDTAVKLDGYTFYKEYESNKVKLSSQYEGTACLVAGTVYEIENDHIVVTDSNLMVNVYIPAEEIIELQKDQYVEVVGILENIDFKQNMSKIWVTVDFNTGYLTKSTYTKTGVFRSYNSTDGSHPQGICLECINDSGNTYYVELVLTEEQKAGLEHGTEITVEGALLINDNTMPHSAYTKLEVITIK